MVLLADHRDRSLACFVDVRHAAPLRPLHPGDVKLYASRGELLL
jgi:hypothetical protein